MPSLRLGVSLQPRWPLDEGTAALRAAGHAEALGFDHVASYAEGIHGMTLASQADALRLAGPLKRTGSMVVQGVAVYGVSSGATSYFSTTNSSTETVYIAASGTPLPVSVSANSGNGIVTTCDFSNWGEPMDLTAPPHPVPLTSIPSA
jgi:hypothetical protein